MAEKKPIKRSKDKIIAGVLAGFANYFDIDPVLIRVLYVVLSIASVGFPGLLVYLILWVVLPEEEEEEED